MKKTLFLFLALLLMGSCQSDLWDAVHDLRDETTVLAAQDSTLAAQDSVLAARITQLETWATTVNTNITALQGLVTALQNNDYVTGVTSFTIPAPGGYTITFTKSAPVTIYNGADGKDGADGAPGDDGITPLISIDLFEGVYYWKLNGNWLLDGSNNKIPATGAKGEKGENGTPGIPGTDAIAPQIQINSTSNEWEISIDGGSSWTSTGVKATGDKGDKGEPGDNGEQGSEGPQGPQGDAIFAANGIDNTHDDYVEFTLADGNTKIKVPKYIAIGITFTQPDLFIANDIKTIAYTTTGTVTTIVALNVPQDWKVAINTSAKTITVTAPATFDSENVRGKVTLLVSDDGDHTVTRTLQLSMAPAQAASTQLWIIEESGIHQIWSDVINMSGCDKDGFNGDIADCRNNPGYGYLYSWYYVNENAATLCPAPWRVPTKDDFVNLHTALSGTAANYTTAWGGSYGGLAYGTSLYNQGSTGYYWSSTEDSYIYAYSLYFHSGQALSNTVGTKDCGFPVRCVK